MKATYNQIEKALNNTLEGNPEIYEAVRACENIAITKIGTQVKKTQHYFSSADWKKVYSEIKKMIA